MAQVQALQALPPPPRPVPRIPAPHFSPAWLPSLQRPPRSFPPCRRASPESAPFPRNTRAGPAPPRGLHKALSSQSNPAPPSRDASADKRRGKYRSCGIYPGLPDSCRRTISGREPPAGFSPPQSRRSHEIRSSRAIPGCTRYRFR